MVPDATPLLTLLAVIDTIPLPVAGSSEPWPDTNNMLPNRMAWASGETGCPGVKPVVGAEDEVMICLGMEPPR